MLCLVGMALAGACTDQVKPVPETRDRLPDSVIERLVEQPMAVVRKSGLPAGEAAFDRLLTETKERKGPRSVEAADLLTAFGVQLYVENSVPGSPESEAARHYLRDAVPAYIAAFGPNNPEVALALNTRADIERKQSPGDPPPLVEALLDQALSIRTQTLGPHNGETVATLTRLADIHALPHRLKRDPAGVVKTDSLYRRAIAGALPGPEGDDLSNKAALEVRLAEFHARSGDPRVALTEVRNALAISKDWRPAERRCLLVESRLYEFGLLMSERGMGNEAEALRPKGHASACNRSAPAETFLASLLRVLGPGSS